MTDFRMGVYPTWIIYSVTVEAPQIVQYFPAYFFFMTLLMSLLLLNIIWTYSILKVIYIALTGPSSTVEGDIRSQSEDSTFEDSMVSETEEKKKN